VLSVIATPTDVASAAAPAPAAAAAVPSVPVAAAALAPDAPPLDDSWPVVEAMMCLRHREEFPLGPHCPRILQFSTNVLEAAAAQFARLRAEIAAVPTATLDDGHIHSGHVQSDYAIRYGMPPLCKSAQRFGPL